MATTTIPEIAHEALRILDADGWNKGAVTSPYAPMPGWDYPEGSHCIGGLWNVALSNLTGQLGDNHSTCLSRDGWQVEQHPEY